MKTTRRGLMVGAALSAIGAHGQERAAGQPLTLWYRKPASKWESEALPIGNGSLGAMVFGQVEHERLQLNEHSLWSGHPEVLDGPETLEALPKVRQLLFEGKYSEAQAMASRDMMLHTRATPASYQTLGDLLLDFAHGDQAEGYRRSLDLDTASRASSIDLRHEVHARGVRVPGRPDRAQQGSSCASRPINPGLSPSASGWRARKTSLSLTTGIARPCADRRATAGCCSPRSSTVRAEGGGVRRTDDGIAGGEGDGGHHLARRGDELPARRADIGPDPVATCRSRAAAVAGMTWEAARDAHVAEHRRLFRRVELDLGGKDLSATPTDERLAAMQAGGDDPQLLATYFQFGRYLLLSSSRPGTLPANLQGLWAQGSTPPWRPITTSTSTSR